MQSAYHCLTFGDNTYVVLIQQVAVKSCYANLTEIFPPTCRAQ